MGYGKDLSLEIAQRFKCAEFIALLLHGRKELCNRHSALDERVISEWHCSRWFKVRKVSGIPTICTGEEANATGDQWYILCNSTSPGTERDHRNCNNPR